MRKLTTNVLCAAGLTLAATGALAAPPGSAAPAGECLSGPKGPAPAGSRWFYRTDHANKRNCWYTRAAGDKSAAPAETAAASPASDDSARAAPASRTETASGDAATVPAAKTIPKPVRTTTVPLHSAIANARAEFDAPPEPAPLREVAAPDQASAFPAPLPAVTDQPPAATQASPIAQRWSDAAVSDAASTAPDAASKLRSAAQTAAAKSTVPAAAFSAGSATMLIAALLAALALAGLIVGGIVKFSRREPMVRRDPNGRPDIWRDVPRPAAAADDVAPGHAELDVDPSPPTQPAEPPAWIRAARQRQAEVQSTNEIEELLARAQKRPAA
ncbi:conserved hypothetical protein [Rhodopseudomonas palustris HaA2]|uniref:Uncharacterized protein n=1 Tax=Rhodopseudomonas palustris (strain HaA2) TaxID=316058 RepID=Q2IX82_RHOP2|nr:hypothetical protein [Rhodopseudomonas palustris]ABD07178.1 conserved hypothetical protein [Rhodopseudomonas palustris HaA2]